VHFGIDNISKLRTFSKLSAHKLFSNLPALQIACFVDQEDYNVVRNQPITPEKYIIHATPSDAHIGKLDQ
jgi:hypothetical protein